MVALVVLIVALDQFLWRPLLAWSERFTVSMVESDTPPTSWFYDALQHARLVNWLGNSLVHPLAEWIDRWTLLRFPVQEHPSQEPKPIRWLPVLLSVLLGLVLLYGLSRAALLLLQLTVGEWLQVGSGVLATFLRVLVALLIALAWTIPVGVAIGTNRRLAAVLQPLVQITASIPATALFPVFLLFLLGLPGGLNLAAMLLMLLGTQWYLLFNIIAGASAIPQDLKYTTTLLHLGAWKRWRTLVLPGLFPYIVTGAITASGGAWNASIVAEYVVLGGQTLQTVGVGATIAQATAAGNYPLLLAATLTMILAVVLLNRLVWRNLYILAEERYRME